MVYAERSIWLTLSEAIDHIATAIADGNRPKALHQLAVACIDGSIKATGRYRWTNNFGNKPAENKESETLAVDFWRLVRDGKATITNDYEIIYKDTRRRLAGC